MTVEGRGWWKCTGVFEGFEQDQVDLDEASIFVRHGGDGPPVVLLHGHPRTSATWHQVAPRLVRRGFTVICPDLRGYGQSRAPEPAADHTAHSKRPTARDVVAVARALGHRRFALAGHDRGGYVALRLALDRPEAVSRLALLDCIPISEHLSRITADFATKWWHWFFFAQPETPERVINADPQAWYRASPEAMGRENYDELQRAVRNPRVVRAMLEDYRAASLSTGGMRRRTEPPGGGYSLRCWCSGRSGTIWKTSTATRSRYGAPGLTMSAATASIPGTIWPRMLQKHSPYH
jgi:haloacetate dehalogenase